MEAPRGDLEIDQRTRAPLSRHHGSTLPMELTPGTRLGPYEVLTPLGAGGMGQVWQARDVNLDRRVAIKVLHDASADDPAWLARFDREARLLAALTHPNIATVHGLDEFEGLRCI